MTNIPIIIPTYNRLKLVKQTIESLKANTPLDLYSLVVVDGGSTDGTREYLESQAIDQLITQSCTSPGQAKNIGVAASKGDLLYISDSDMYFKPGWLETLIKAYTDEMAVLGALGHPWWPTIGKTYVGGIPGEKAGIEVCYAEQQPGYSWFMRRSMWEQCGPLKEGVGYGVDDTEFCNRAKGLTFSLPYYKVGHLKEELVLHCGIKRADGSVTYGALDQIKDYPEGVITE
jgi:glycosyltransferase involved in cell wall biosynthesis